MNNIKVPRKIANMYKFLIIVILIFPLFFFININKEENIVDKKDSIVNKKENIVKSESNMNNVDKYINKNSGVEIKVEAKSFVFLTSDNSGFVLDDETKDKLLNSKEDSFSTENILAQRASVKFLKTGYKIWAINTYPGLSGEPASAIGVVDNKLVLLADLASTIDFYNQAVIVPNDKALITDLALNILKIAYYKDEFEYGEDAINARGYKAINSVKDIKTKDINNYGRLIAKPSTSVSGDMEKYVFKTTIWFWGAHNCELHRFDMMSERAIGTSLAGKSQFKITGFKDEVITKLGECSPLFYK